MILILLRVRPFRIQDDDDDIKESFSCVFVCVLNSSLEFEAETKACRHGGAL